jgi:type II secretory ATPase GspE/PulE/Tfp pilus assembly ATPase PilB-like protein
MNTLQERYAQLVSSLSDKKKSAWLGTSASKPIAPTGLTSQIVDLILEQAVVERASDVHFEPEDGKVRVRYRVDGQLYEVLTVDQDPNISIIARLKVMAGLQTDAMSKRKPQDGRFTLKIGQYDFDFRMATFPTLKGEKVAIRVLNKDFGLYRLDRLGVDGHDLGRLSRLLQHKNGLLLVSGPTGCGKTTTLYAILNQLNSPKINIITLEDPVEYQMNGMNQCDVKRQMEFNFADGLRAVLRQDPDIILVGEIRDTETAEIAIRASMTGHLVLSSLHANSAMGTVIRLVNMGLERYMVSYAVIGAIAQRLVRRICEHCRVQYTIGPEELSRLKSYYGVDFRTSTPSKEKTAEGLISYLDQGESEEMSTGAVFYKGKGCVQCNGTGYRGRLGIFEIVVFETELRDAILRGAPTAELQAIAMRQGTKSLAMDVIEKVKKGITTLEEMYAVVVEK